MYKRGEIYYIHKGDVRTMGSEQEAGRPAIIVSNNKANEYSPVVEVVYLTTQPKTDLPTHCTIRSAAHKSTALCEQITSVYTDRIGNYIGMCTDDEMDQVDECLMVSIGLDGFCEACSLYRDEVDAKETQVKKDEAHKKYVVGIEQDNARLKEEVIRAQAERDVFLRLYNELLAKTMTR